MSHAVNEVNYFCLVCYRPHEEPLIEDWIKCSSCKKWCHDKSTDYTGKGLFVSDFCKDA